METILETRNVNKSFAGTKALSDVSATFQDFTIHGIIGENGAGKSTLVKILTGLYHADSGEVLIQGTNVETDRSLHNQIGYVPQEIDLFPELSVAENLAMPFARSGLHGVILNRQKMNKIVRPILDRFKINLKPDTLVRNTSVSQQQLLQIARASMYQNCRVLILDEPTTSLTTNDVRVLFEVLRDLKSQGYSIIFISHKLEELTDICDDLLVLRNGSVVGHSAIDNVSRSWIINKMLGRELNEDDTFIPKSPSQDEYLRVENLSGRDFHDISFRVYRGEILGFAGLIGAGRSEIMQTIFGLRKAYSGTVVFKNQTLKLGDPPHCINQGIFYLPEERKQQAILPLLSVKENISIPLLNQVSNGPFLSLKKESRLVNEAMKRYDVRTPSASTRIVYLSGGNQQKAIIGRTMMCNPKLLIFDEPTKGIDVGTKAEIYKLMKELVETQNISIILISSDVQELLRCSNRIITIYQGRSNAVFSGSTIQESSVLDAMLGGKVQTGMES